MNSFGFFEALICFVLGIIVGSFVNVVVARLPRGRSLIHPGSRCGFCRSSIRFYQNIPLFSFLWSGGSCGQCGHPYSVRYFVIELLMGLLGVAVGAVYGFSILGGWFLCLTALLVAVSFIDLELKIIPDSLSLGAWGFSLIVIGFGIVELPAFASGQGLRGLLGTGPLVTAFVSSVIGYGSLWILSNAYYFIKREEGLGGGDVKLMGLIGATLGLEGIITSLLVGSLLGSIVGIYFIYVRRKSRHFPFPFGPFLSIGAMVSVLRLSHWFFI